MRNIKECAELQRSIASWCGTAPDRVTFYYKGRVALYALLKAMGVCPGDEVVMPALTCVVVPNAVVYLGAKPVYVDIELKTFSVRAEAIDQSITSATKAVLCQNTYGLSADVDKIAGRCRERSIWTVEDCTHGFGGTYKGKPNGSWCDAAFFSSQWNKPFSSGVGGYAIVRDHGLSREVGLFASTLPEPSLKTRISLRFLLSARSAIRPSVYYPLVRLYRYLSHRNLVAGSSSGTELEGTEMPHDYLMAMSQVQRKAALRALRGLPRLNGIRRSNGLLYTSHLAEAGLNFVDPEFHEDHLFLKYPLLVRNRQEFMRRAMRASIPLGDWFLSPLHPVECDLGPWGFDREKYPNAVFAAEHVVNLPTDTEHPEKVLEFVDRNSDLVFDSTLDGRLPG